MSPPEPFVEPTPRRVRVMSGDETVAVSTRALLLSWYGPGKLPTYAIPEADVHTELLTPASDGTPSVPHTTAFDVVTDGERVPGAFRFDDLPAPLARANGHWTFGWDNGLTWFEEAIEVHVHARDPRKRVDVLPSDRHIRVELDGELLAESHRPHALFETTLPTRWYLPRQDVRFDLLEPSITVTRCPYKGTAVYWSARIGDTLHQDLAWSYPEPIIECPRIAGLVCFFNERVDLIVDGDRVDRPDTPWSRPAAET